MASRVNVLIGNGSQRFPDLRGLATRKVNIEEVSQTTLR